MRQLARDQVNIYYSLQTDVKTPILDELGYETGEYEHGYLPLVKIKCTVSSAKGKTIDEIFGRDMEYTKALTIYDPACPIDEFSRLWVDTVPVLKEDGSTDTKNDYEVLRRSVSHNTIVYAIKKVI